MLTKGFNSTCKEGEGQRSEVGFLPLIGEEFLIMKRLFIASRHRNFFLLFSILVVLMLYLWFPAIFVFTKDVI